MKIDGEQPYHQNNAPDVPSKVDRPDGKLSTIDIFNVESLWEDFGHSISGNQNVSEQYAVNPNTTGLVVEEKHFSVEKTATATELPKMVVSLNNGASEVVKDICVDEGLHSLMKISIESEHGKNDFSNFEHSAANGNRDVAKELADGAAGITGDVESRLDRNSGEEHFFIDSFSSRDKPKAVEAIAGDISNGKISLKELLSTDDYASEPQKVSPIGSNFSSDHKKSFIGGIVEQDTAKNCYAVPSVASETATVNQASKFKESPVNGIPNGSLEDRSATITVFFNDNETNQSSTPNAHIANGLSESTSQATLFPTTFERLDAAEPNHAISNMVIFDTLANSDALVVNQVNGRNQNPFNSPIDNGVDIDDFNPRAGERGGMDGSKETTKGSKQFNHAEKDSADGGTKIDGATSSVRNSGHHNDGDIMSSGPIVSSGPKAPSGHIPYSGSISHRSDSSTTSTRSFAFPILQAEWNASPVKMAKADRRHLRKHRGWRMGFLCCRF